MAITTVKVTELLVHYSDHASRCTGIPPSPVYRREAEAWGDYVPSHPAGKRERGLTQEGKLQSLGAHRELRCPRGSA